MTNVLTVSEMQANVAQSQEHVAKQEAIIARLVGQGHDAMTADARDLLVTMHAHLAVEMEMLANMQAG